MNMLVFRFKNVVVSTEKISSKAIKKVSRPNQMNIRFTVLNNTMIQFDHMLKCSDRTKCSPNVH